MLGRLHRLNSLGTLRFRLRLLVLLGVGALALFMSSEFSRHLTSAYKKAGETQLKGIAETWDNGFSTRDLSRPNVLQARINKLRDSNETLQDLDLLAQPPRRHADRAERSRPRPERHEARRHDPPGRAVPQLAPGADRRPEWSYREVRDTDGVHYSELNYPILRRGRVAAALELRYDLKTLDQTLAHEKETLAIAAALAALALTLVLNVLLGRAVLTPIEKLRQATRRIGSGEVGTRLDWKRRDEIGGLASDFDRMAAELQTVHAHLEGLALKDPLTGLLNHRAFQERVGQELRRAEREGYALSIVALDVDNFKEINDRWGHAAGDEALRILARSIRAALRPSDVCGRVGGDEFMLAIIRSKAEEAIAVVERLRTVIAGMQFGPAGQSLTISAGVSEFPRHSLSQEELVHLADGAMYWAKSNGRNRSFVYTSENDFALSAQEAADKVAQEGLVNTVHALAKAVDAKDGYTHSHSQRVARYAATLAKELDMDLQRVEMVRTAGVLHDVGKIGIADILLLKPDALTDEEFATMRRHSELGRDIIAGAGMHDIARCVLHLHERFDGAGYPYGLAGQDIPLESRVLHVADALEAMTSSRVYRPALPVEVALAELERHAGTQFDPEVAALMVRLVRLGVLEVSEAEVPRAEAASELLGLPRIAGLLGPGGGDSGEPDSGAADEAGARCS